MSVSGILAARCPDYIEFSLGLYWSTGGDVDRGAVDYLNGYAASTGVMVIWVGHLG